MDSFKDFYDKSQRPGIGFFPGGFKPPHAGHFAAVQSILGYSAVNPETKKDILLPGSNTSEFVYIIIGHSPRGTPMQNTQLTKLKKDKRVKDIDDIQQSMITKEISEKIWNLYIDQSDPELRGKTDVVISPHASPVIGMEEMILSLESDQFKNNTINLYAGQEDQARYKYFTSEKFISRISQEKNIDPVHVSIKANMLDRLGSATDVRSQIIRVAAQQADTDTLSQYIPAGVDVLTVLNLLKNFREG
jgi:hypothetical protein